MFTRDSKIHATLNLNEYIEKMSEVKPHLDEIINLPIEEVKIVSDGCKKSLVKKVMEYLKAHDILIHEEYSVSELTKEDRAFLDNLMNNGLPEYLSEHLDDENRFYKDKIELEYFQDALDAHGYKEGTDKYRLMMEYIGY